MSTPFRPIAPGVLCTCGHTIGKHDFLFTEPHTTYGLADRYRCNACDCGSKFRPQIVPMREGETQDEFMERVTANP